VVRFSPWELDEWRRSRPVLEGPRGETPRGYLTKRLDVDRVNTGYADTRSARPDQKARRGAILRATAESLIGIVQVNFNINVNKGC
jgi:hypothetical protein